MASTKEYYQGYHVSRDPCQVDFLAALGSDLTVVNAARVSFGTSSQTLCEQDKKLIRYLAENKHWSPFRHCFLQLRLVIPEFVARQLYKHVVGIEATSTHPTKDHAWNEISGRYREMKRLYIPRVWNSQHPKSKQCSGDPLDEKSQRHIDWLFSRCVESTMSCYSEMLKCGLAKEQARMILPLCFTTEICWTASLQAIHNFVILRNDPHSQHEIRVLASKLDEIAMLHFPVSYDALRRSTTANAEA